MMRQRSMQLFLDSSTNIEQEIIQTKEDQKLPPVHQIKGVIFDMDGTLIKPCIDFSDMRNRVYAIADSDSSLKHKPEEERRGDVLELYHFLSDEGKKLAKDVFDDIEAKAIRDMTLMDSVADVCHHLDQLGIKRAVLTRNVEESVNVMQQKLMDESGVKDFYPCVNRNTKANEDDIDPLPSKPNPDAILHICKIWGCEPKDVLMVGDSEADDMAAASRAGCGGRVLLKYNGVSHDNDAGGGGPTSDIERQERKPTVTVQNLGEIIDLLK